MADTRTGTALQDAGSRQGFRRGDNVWTASKRRAMLLRFRKGDGYWDCRYSNGEQGIIQPKHMTLIEEGE